MMIPNTMFRPPNPTAVNHGHSMPGANSASAPNTMKQTPINGTIRTENALAVATAVPYSSSHVPGINAKRPARYNAIVNSAPTTIGGKKLSPKRRPGPESKGSLAARAFCTIAAPPITTPSTASPNHTASQSASRACRSASHVAASAVHPTTTMPQPGTAVNEPARSIAERMNWRLSSARSWSGRGAVMARSKALCVAKSSAPSGEPAHQLQARPDVVDRRDLHIHEARGQGDRTYDVFGDVSGYARCFLRPGNPKAPVRRQRPQQHRNLRLENRATDSEKMYEGKIASRRGDDVNARRQLAERAAVAAGRV